MVLDRAAAEEVRAQAQRAAATAAKYRFRSDLELQMKVARLLAWSDQLMSSGTIYVHRNETLSSNLTATPGHAQGRVPCSF